jgi:hypothetical protein
MRPSKNTMTALRGSRSASSLVREGPMPNSARSIQPDVTKSKNRIESASGSVDASFPSRVQCRSMSVSLLSIGSKAIAANVSRSTGNSRPCATTMRPTNSASSLKHERKAMRAKFVSHVCGSSVSKVAQSAAATTRRSIRRITATNNCALLG